MSNTSVNPHPFTAVENLGKALLLLILPVVRGLTLALLGKSLVSWLLGAWFDILIVLIIIAYAFVKYKRFTYFTTSDYIHIAKGIIVRRRFSIPFNKISTLSISSPFLLRPFKIVHLYIDTLAGAPSRSDIKLTLSKSEAERIAHIRTQHLNDVVFSQKYYEPQFRYIGLLSIILSNGLYGVIFIAVSISQLGEVLGDELQNRIVGTLASVSKAIAFGLPPLTAFLALLIAIGWVVALLRNMMRYFRFNVTRQKDILTISGGLFSKQQHLLSISNVNYLDIRQSLFTKIFSIFMVFVDCTGYGKLDNLSPTLIPASNKNELKSRVRTLLPEYKLIPRQIKPIMMSSVRYLWQPFLLCAVLLYLGLVVSVLIPSWNDVIVSVTVIGFIPAVWWFFVGIADLNTAGVSADEKCITLIYAKGFYLHTAVIPKDKITMINLRQSIFQKTYGACDVIVSSYAEGRKKHRVKNLDKSEVEKLLGVV